MISGGETIVRQASELLALQGCCNASDASELECLISTFPLAGRSHYRPMTWAGGRNRSGWFWTYTDCRQTCCLCINLSYSRPGSKAANTSIWFAQIRCPCMHVLVTKVHFKGPHKMTGIAVVCSQDKVWQTTAITGWYCSAYTTTTRWSSHLHPVLAYETLQLQWWGLQEVMWLGQHTIFWIGHIQHLQLLDCELAISANLLAYELLIYNWLALLEGKHYL